MSGLKVVLSDPSYKVRKAFAQVVITLGSHDYLKLEGGYFHVEFIIRQCSITRDEDDKYSKLPKKDADAVSPKELRTMCDSILSMLTTTIPCMEDVRAARPHTCVPRRAVCGSSDEPGGDPMCADKGGLRVHRSSGRTCSRWWCPRSTWTPSAS